MFNGNHIAHMMTSSNGNIFCVTGFSYEVTGEFPLKGQWRGTLMFSLICVWINGWCWSWWSRPLWRNCNEQIIGGGGTVLRLRCRLAGRRWGLSMCASCEHHDDVIKSKHISHYWTIVRGIHPWPVNSPHKGRWRGALVFSLIYAWTNVWANSRDAGGLRRHWTHCDVIVIVHVCMYLWLHLHLAKFGIAFNSCVFLFAFSCYQLCGITQRTPTLDPFYQHDFTLTPVCISNYIIIKYGKKLLIHSQTSTLQPLKFGKWRVISPHWAGDFNWEIVLKASLQRFQTSCQDVLQTKLDPSIRGLSVDGTASGSYYCDDDTSIRNCVLLRSLGST